MERRKKRIVILKDGSQVITIRTYKRHRAFILKKYGETPIYNRKSRSYLFKTSVTPIREPKREPERAQKRIRYQVVFNKKLHDEPYYISVRAMTLNPDITERGLRIAIIEIIGEINKSSNYNIDVSNDDFEGLSAQEITSNMDKALNDYRVHVEILIKKNSPIYLVR